MEQAKIRMDSAKIRMPDISTAVSRPRLIKRLEKNKHKNLIFITGQAAQGKSTLAASYISSSGLPCAWINLGAEDSNPLTLLHALIFSLENTLPGIDLSDLKDYSALSAGPRDEAGLYRDWLCSLFAQLSLPMHIVFDGLDRFDSDAPSKLFLKVCSEAVVPGIHVWFISRTGEPLSIEEFKMNPASVVIENHELSFTRPEISKYFFKFNRIQLDADHLARIQRLTEGWAGGLILLSDAIDRMPEEKRDTYLSSEISSHFRIQASQYFGAEILASLSESTQRFLIVSSIFETIDPGLVGELHRGVNCRDILSGLVRRNLFVHSIHDENDGWLFRYHQLFRDYLLSRFHSDLDPDDRTAILYQAGLLYESRGRLENAARFYIQCGQYINAVSLIEAIGTDLLKMGRSAHLAMLINDLPERHVQNNPWLLLYIAATQRFTGADENTLSLRRVLTLFKEKDSVPGQLLALAFLIESSTIRGRDTIPMGILLEEAETLLYALPAESYPWESATLWYQFGFCVGLRAGDQRKAYQACQNAYLLARAAGNRPLQVAALAAALLPLSVMGEFALADKLTKKALSTLEKNPYPELRAWYLLNCSQASTVKGDFSSARECAAEAREITEAHGLIYLYPVALLSELMFKPQVGEFLDGEETGRELLQFAEAFGLELLSAVASMFMGLCLYLRQDYEGAKRCYQTSCRMASSNAAYSDTHISWNRILLGLIYIHEKNCATAEVLLNEALDHFSEINSPLTLVVIHWALAFGKHSQNMRDQAVFHLKTGIQIARDRGFYHTFFMNKEDILRVGWLCVAYDLKETEPYVSKFLALRLGRDAIDELRRWIGQSKTASSRMAHRVLKYIHRHNLPRIRVETLNGFSVYRDGCRIGDDEWGGSLPQSLLKAIITRGGRQVPRERVMEDLWPGASPSSSERNFKVNLHRLRKVLEPSMLKELGSSYIGLTGNLISLDDRLCQTDAVEFSELCSSASAAKIQGDSKSAIERLEAASELYKKDFLIEELYNDAIGRKRDRLRRKYADCLFQLAGLYEMKGSVKKAEGLYEKIIASDPLSAAAYRKLMLCYSNRGNSAGVIKIYQAFERRLRTELDAEPDDLTRSIYEKVIAEN